MPSNVPHPCAMRRRVSYGRRPDRPERGRGVAAPVDFLVRQIRRYGQASAPHDQRVRATGCIADGSLPSRNTSAKCGGHAACSDGLKALAVIGVQHAERGLAQPHRLFQHRIEHRREIAGRGVDDLQHLGGRGLLLQCLALLGDQPRFSIAITAWAAKFCNSAICLSVKGRTSWR